MSIFDWTKAQPRESKEKSQGAGVDSRDAHPANAGRELGLAQIELARRVGISASYLNLIEWNKRRVAGVRLRRIAEALDLPIDELGGLSERRLAEALAEIARILPSLDGLGIEDGADRRADRGDSRAGPARSRRWRARSARRWLEPASSPTACPTIRFSARRCTGCSPGSPPSRSAAEILTEYTDIPADRSVRRFSADHSTRRAPRLSGGRRGPGRLSGQGRGHGPRADADGPRSRRSSQHAATGSKRSKQRRRSWAGLLTDHLPVPRPGEGGRARGANDSARNRSGRMIAREPLNRDRETARTRARKALLEYAAAAILMPMESLARSLGGRSATMSKPSGGVVLDRGGVRSAAASPPCTATACTATARRRRGTAVRVPPRQRGGHDHRDDRARGACGATLRRRLSAVGAVSRAADSGGGGAPAGAVSVGCAVRVSRPRAALRPHRIRPAAPLPDRHAGDGRGGCRAHGLRAEALRPSSRRSGRAAGCARAGGRPVRTGSRIRWRSSGCET